MMSYQQHIFLSFGQKENNSLSAEVDLINVLQDLTWSPHHPTLKRVKKKEKQTQTEKAIPLLHASKNNPEESCAKKLPRDFTKRCHMNIN